MNFVALIVFGLVIGMLAKVLIKDRNPAKYLYTLAAGIAGSLIGGAMANMHFVRSAAETAGWMIAIVGAVIWTQFNESLT